MVKLARDIEPWSVKKQNQSKNLKSLRAITKTSLILLSLKEKIQKKQLIKPDKNKKEAKLNNFKECRKRATKPFFPRHNVLRRKYQKFTIKTIG